MKSHRLRKPLTVVRETASGQMFRFTVKDAELLRSLKAGQSFGIRPKLQGFMAHQHFSILRISRAQRRQQVARDCCELTDIGKPSQRGGIQRGEQPAPNTPPTHQK